MSVPCAGDVGPWIVADRVDDLRLPIRPDAFYDEHVPEIFTRVSPDEASMVGGAVDVSAEILASSGSGTPPATKSAVAPLAAIRRTQRSGDQCRHF